MAKQTTTFVMKQANSLTRLTVLASPPSPPHFFSCPHSHFPGIALAKKALVQKLLLQAVS